MSDTNIQKAIARLEAMDVPLRIYVGTQTERNTVNLLILALPNIIALLAATDRTHDVCCTCRVFSPEYIDPRCKTADSLATLILGETETDD